MKTTKFFMLAALALSATACSNDNDTTTYGPREAVITAGINTPVTRANGATWENDKIGVMVTAAPSSEMENIYKNVQYATTSESSDAATFTASTGAGIFFQDASETVTFAAYGPYQTSDNAATLPGSNGVISDISTNILVTILIEGCRKDNPDLCLYAVDGLLTAGVASPTGIEPMAYCLGGSRSILLSYGDI